jgi:hypothetical protein
VIKARGGEKVGKSMQKSQRSKKYGENKESRIFFQYLGNDWMKD